MVLLTVSGCKKVLPSEGGRREGCQGAGGCCFEKRWFGEGIGGTMGCASKPFASRLCRFSVLFVGCVAISLLRLSDFGRRLFSRFTVIFVSCIAISDLNLSDFGRRLCFISVGSQFAVIFVSCITISFLCLTDFGRRLCFPVPFCELYRTQLS